jgi:hypothetical protein
MMMLMILFDLESGYYYLEWMLTVGRKMRSGGGGGGGRHF